MDSISNLISNKANSLFEPNFPDTDSIEQPILITAENLSENTGGNIDLDVEIKNIDTQITNQNDSCIMHTPTINEQVKVEQKISDSPMSIAIHADTKTNDSSPDLIKIKFMLHQIKDQIDAALRLINGEAVTGAQTTQSSFSVVSETNEQVLEGVFNGEKMIGTDGKEYAVPPNYASKSKLVEGDILKLTITNSGRFIYKQISPIEKQRLIGELISDPNNEQWCALANGKTYKLLTASVTFYKGVSGDDVVFFVPKNRDCSWGAVENIIHKHR